jgi:excinuclease ABC subunit A
LERLRDHGDTVVVIEHNLDVIKRADYIIDLGPEGGDQGGEVVAQGTPEELARVEYSYTGQFLKKVFNRAEENRAREEAAFRGEPGRGEVGSLG